MANDPMDCREQGKDKAGLQTVSPEEKERLLAELESLLDKLLPPLAGEAEPAVGRDPDWSFSNFSFGLGIDPNG